MDIAIAASLEYDMAGNDLSWKSYEFKIPICIDVRYNIGITKVNKESEPGYKDSKNQMASITIGYKFGL